LLRLFLESIEILFSSKRLVYRILILLSSAILLTFLIISSDPSGEFIYVMDIDNNRVQKFDKNGEFIMEWGSLGIGDGEAKLILQNYEKHEELFTSLYIMGALYYYA